MRKILARILYCELEYLDNVLIHMIPGAANVTIAIILHAINLPWVGISLAVIFAWGFLKYQTTERKVIRDRCYPDIQGFLYGIAFAAIGYGIARLIW